MGEPLAPFQKHSETSRQAAVGIHTTKETLRHMVQTVLEGRGLWGATDEEIQDELHLDGSTERPRRVELVRAGKVRDSGQKRRTKSGRRATVWVGTRLFRRTV